MGEQLINVLVQAIEQDIRVEESWVSMKIKQHLRFCMAMFALNYKYVECQFLGGRIIFNVGDLSIE